MDNEVWKDIQGYEGRYQISTCGRVKSLSHVRYLGTSGYKRFKEKMLAPVYNQKGYARVGLKDKNHHQRTLSIHRLVAEAFIPNPDNLPQVNHKDENKSNNNVENLEWTSCKDNVNYGTGVKRRSITQRYTEPNMKTVYQYTKDGDFIRSYISTAEAGRITGFERSGISCACRNKKRFEFYKGYKWSYEKIET